MVSLLRNSDIDSTSPSDLQRDLRSIATNKLASRVGASLLKAVGLDDLVFSDMIQYEDAMVRCALDKEWFNAVRRRLLSSKDSSPLFDTERWVQNLEAALNKLLELNLDKMGRPINPPDIVIIDSSESRASKHQ
jgi:hypothetical protein